jgi:hypothetical protein
MVCNFWGTFWQAAVSVRSPFIKILKVDSDKINCIRHIRKLFKKNDLCQFPPWEALTQHWESELLVEPKKIFQTDGVQSGICYDPVSFIPKYLERFLKRRALERSPLPPGDYNILFKVFSNLYVLLVIYYILGYSWGFTIYKRINPYQLYS